jgi:phosphoglycerol transferase
VESIQEVPRLPRLAVSRRAPARADVIGGLLAAVGSLLAATFSLQLWHMHLGAPLVFNSDDSVLQAAVVKLAIHGNGWIYSNSQLGAPFGINFGDFPLGTDNLNYAAMWVIGRFTGNVASVENLFLLLTFPLEAVCGYAVMRWMRISIPSAVVCAVLFAAAPYHLFHDETELLLSQYVTAPIATYLAISILDGRRLFTGCRGPRQWRELLTRRNAWLLLLVIVIASTGVYYAAFSILILAACGISAAVTRRRVAPLAHTLVLVAAIAGVVFLNDLPNAVYRLEHGKNPVVSVRPPLDSEAYGLKLAAMALPVPGDRIAPLAKLRAKYDTGNALPSESQPQALGTVGTIGLLGLLLISLGAIGGLRLAGRRGRLQMQLGFITVVALLLATVGGVSSLIAYTLFTQIRTWARMAVFIDFFALVAVAIWLDLIAQRWLRDRRLLAAAGLLAVALFGVYDQSSLQAIPAYAKTQKRWRSAGALVAAMQRVLPKNAAVFELPYVHFPESPPVAGTGPYNQITGWLQSDDLRWSFPTMWQRPQDWAGQTSYLPTRTLLDAISAAGFDGIWIDRHGYVGQNPLLIPELQKMLNEQPVSSPDGRYVFFDLRRFAARLRAHTAPAKLAALRQAVLHPPGSYVSAGFYGGGPDGTSTWAVNYVTMQATNSTGRPRRVVFYTQVHSATPGNFTLSITLPDGQVKKFPFNQRQRLIEFPLTLPPGTSAINLASNATAVTAPASPTTASVWYGGMFLAGTGLQPFLPRSASAPLQ